MRVDLDSLSRSWAKASCRAGFQIPVAFLLLRQKFGKIVTRPSPCFQVIWPSVLPFSPQSAYSSSEELQLLCSEWSIACLGWTWARAVLNQLISLWKATGQKSSCLLNLVCHRELIVCSNAWLTSFVSKQRVWLAGIFKDLTGFRNPDQMSNASSKTRRICCGQFFNTWQLPSQFTCSQQNKWS